MASQLKPDAIVLGFVMPMLNGMEAAREILKIMPSVPIVLYPLHKNLQLELDASELGICKVISKGEDSNALIAVLQELLASSETSLGPIGLPSESSAKLRIVPKIVPNLGSDLQKQIPRKPAGHELERVRQLTCTFATKILRQQPMLVTRSKHRPEPRPPTPLASLLRA